NGFRKVDIRDFLCQHWELEHMEEVSSIELVLDKKNKRIFPELALFKDSTALENPRSHFRIGTWRVKVINKRPVVNLLFPGDIQEQYLIRDICASRIWLARKGEKDSLYITLTADGLTHQNMYNDPFHP